MQIDDEYRQGKQPCDNFVRGEFEYYYYDIRISHCCPRCNSEDGVRVFCETCCRDHHVGGWESCIEVQPEREDGT